MITPNLYTAAKRRRMSLADEDREFDEGVGAGFASGSKVDVVSVILQSSRFVHARAIVAARRDRSHGQVRRVGSDTP